jgi:hypothetical protein
MQPFNYIIDVPNPDEAFASGLKSGNAMLAARNERARQEAAMAEKQAQQQILGLVNTELQGVMGSNDPLAYLAAQRRVLEKGGAKAAELFNGQYKTFDDSTKNAAFDAGQRAFALAATGDAMGAKRSLEQSATAFDRINPPMAKVIRDAATRMEANPEQAKTTLGWLLAGVDPDKFKKFGEAVTGKEGTAFQKDYEFILGKYGQDVADKLVEARTDPTSVIPLPGNRGVYVGPRSGIATAMGGGGGASTGVSVTTPDGQTFNFPNENAARLFKKKAGLE